WSRVDLPPVSELRRTADRKLVMELERTDVSALLAAGWRPPEVLMAMGRDGKTDIWGIIHRPINFDSSKKYPVVESIYAGPQGSFVPKSFSVSTQPLTELGFSQKNMPTLSSGVLAKFMSQNSISQYSDQPSVENGVLKMPRCVRYLAFMKPCK